MTDAGEPDKEGPAEGQLGGDAGGEIRAEVGGLIEGIVIDVLARADVSKRIRSGAQFHQRISVPKTAFTLGFCIATQNYAGALFVVVNHVAGGKVSSAAADIILEKGGFAARLELDRELRASHSKLLAATFQPHSSASILQIYREHVYWGALRAQELGELAMAAVDLSQGSARSADDIARSVDPRPYRRLGWVQRDALYRGTWESDEREGWGTLVYPKFGTYSGSWSAGSPTGYGEISYEDGGSYSGEIQPGSGDRLLGVSVSSEGVVYAGEHRFPLYVFPDGTDTPNTRILADGYGVRIVDGQVLHATWRGGEVETELRTEPGHMAEIFKDIVARGKAPPEFGVRAAEWRLEEAKLNSVWAVLEQRVRTSGTVFFFDRTI